MTVFVVHCVDTEGPLCEPVEATFERLKTVYGIDLEPNKETLSKLQTKQFDLGSRELEQSIARMLDPNNLNYMDSWENLETMLDRLEKPGLRMAVPDKAGNGWRINWHCLAHQGFDPSKNPRGRDLGVHSVYDRYRRRCAESVWGDSVHWHFHPVPRTRQANHCATAYFTVPIIFEIISRRILERLWFPCVNHSGFHAERPDSHWFLEQWMPFDISNTMKDKETDQIDLSGGRFGDWHRAPRDWIIYHPHHDDYQRPGNCRRAVARSLYLGGRLYRIDQEEVDKAFAQGRNGPTPMVFYNHDYRNMEPEIQEMQNMLAEASKKFPDVDWRYAEVAAAFRAVMNLAEEPHAEFDLALRQYGASAHKLDISLDRFPFGPQPWLCYAMKDGTVWYDNLDLGSEPRRWSYIFDEQTAPIDHISLIGLATNTAYGRTTVVTLDPTTGKIQTAYHN